MKNILLFLSVLIAAPALAEHDAKYCGTALAGEAGSDLSGTKFELILQVQCESFVLDEQYFGYAGIRELTAQQKSSIQLGKSYCAKGRWAGPNPCDNDDIKDIKTNSVYVPKLTKFRP